MYFQSGVSTGFSIPFPSNDAEWLSLLHSEREDARKRHRFSSTMRWMKIDYKSFTRYSAKKVLIMDGMAVSLCLVECSSTGMAHYRRDIVYIFASTAMLRTIACPILLRVVRGG